MFSNAVVAALVALPFVAQSVLAGDCVRSYTIQEGDICDSISAEHKVSTYQLATINDGYIDKACSNLVPGATICLGYENEDCNETHVVVADDTCEAIAKSYSIDEATLYNSNPNVLDDCSNIYIGEVLAVCTEVIIPPAGTAPVNTAVPVTATAVVDATSSAAPVAVAAPTVAAAPAALVPVAEEATDDEEYDEEYDDESLPYCDEL